MGKNTKIIFITGTDTDVGKTAVTLSLGLVLQREGARVGVMKPVQCAGSDAAFLKTRLNLDDDLKLINPFYAPEPLSPHLAFKRAKMTFRLSRVRKTLEQLKNKCDVILVEGAGGILCPITEKYLMTDLMRDLALTPGCDFQAVIVSRLGLGTLNHTLLTVEQTRHRGLPVGGVIFNEQTVIKKGLAEKDNPFSVQAIGQVPVLGTLPYCKNLKERDILKSAGRWNLKPLLSARKKSRTKTLQKWDKDYVWHPFTQMKDWLTEQPLIIDRAQGSYLIDTDGNKYLDGISSLWVNVHGHRKKEVDAAVKKQIDKLAHSTLLGLANTPSVELAKKLVEITPKGLAKVFYSDSGSTANEIAVKIAYQYWQNIGQTKKRKIVHLSNSYHGDTLGSVSVGGIDLFHKVYRGLVFETIQLDFCDGYRAPKGKRYPDYAFECLDKFERVLKKKNAQIACLIVEPIVQGAAGMLMWPKGALKRMEQLCRRYNILFIVDEVATGFGRTGRMFACEHENVRPDILCLAKGITGGYLPLAATLTTQKVYAGFLREYKEQKTFFHGHTYTGNPLGCAAALANLEIFSKEKTLIKLQPRIKYLTRELKRFKSLPHVGDVRQRGFMVGIELVKNKRTKTPFDWKDRVGVKVCEALRAKGIILRPLGNVIVLMPPLSMSRAELKYLLNALYSVLLKLT